MNKKIIKYLPANLILKEQSENGALVLGDCNSAVDFSIVKHNKIKTIISIGLQALPNKQKIGEGIQHHFYDIHDNKQQKLSVQLLDEVSNLISEGRKRGGVLIHCYAGVSRSSSFVIAYIINKYKVGYDQAKEKVKKGRPCIHPGDGFVRQLQFYAKVIQKREEERLASLKKKEVKQQQEVNMKESNNQTSPSQRVRRGVRGAVRSAEHFSPQKLKGNNANESINNPKTQKIEEKKQQEQTKSIQLKQKEQKSQKLPLIQLKQSRYQKSSSVLQVKRNIDKIEGRSNKLNISSIRGIYGNKTKVL